MLSFFTCNKQNCENRSQVISLRDAAGLLHPANSRVLAVVRKYQSMTVWQKIHVTRTCLLNHASCHGSPSEQALLIIRINLIYDLSLSFNGCGFVKGAGKYGRFSCETHFSPSSALNPEFSPSFFRSHNQVS